MIDRLALASAQWPPPNHSGDLLVVQRHSDDQMTVLLADVAGNGPEASRLATWVRPICERALAQITSPARWLESVNEICVDQLPDGSFITSVAAHIDARECTLRVASAGHLGPIVRRRAGGCRQVTNPGGPPLGILRGQRFPQTQVDLESGDLVVFVTDGISDRFAGPEDWSGATGVAARLHALPAHPSAICHRLLWDGHSDSETDATAAVVQLQQLPTCRSATRAVNFDVATGFAKLEPGSSHRQPSRI